MEQIAATWNRVGTGAREVFLMQKMDELIRIVMGTVHHLKVERLTVLGGVGAGTSSNGTPLAGVDLGNVAGRLISANEQLKAAVGVDLLGAVEGRLSGKPTHTTGKGT
jgi:uncharacterized membrane protein YqiK